MISLAYKKFCSALCNVCSKALNVRSKALNVRSKALNGLFIVVYRVNASNFLPFNI